MNLIKVQTIRCRSYHVDSYEGGQKAKTLRETQVLGGLIFLKELKTLRISNGKRFSIKIRDLEGSRNKEGGHEGALYESPARKPG